MVKDVDLNMKEDLVEVVVEVHKESATNFKEKENVHMVKDVDLNMKEDPVEMVVNYQKMMK